jgi:hypothetical protein
MVIHLVNTDFIEVTVFALKKWPNATKCSDHRTISVTSHTAKIVTRTLKSRIEGKLRMHLEKTSMGLEEEKELRMQLGC